MKSLKNRIATGVLAGAMAMSLAVPAFAATNTTTKVTATYSEIPISVTVPAAATVQINPMGMPVKLPVTDADNDKNTEVGFQIVTMPSAIINSSSMDLAVGATVTGTVKGNFKFAATGWDSSDATKIPTTNSAFVILEMKKGVDVLDKSGETPVVDATKIGTAWGAWGEQDFATDFSTEQGVADKVAGTDDADDAVVVLSTKATTSTQGLVKLAAADADGVPTDNSVGLFRLSGQVVENPKTPWAKTDGFGATIAFTFKASKPAAGGGAG
jgi:hypothetical protein